MCISGSFSCCFICHICDAQVKELTGEVAGLEERLRATEEKRKKAVADAASAMRESETQARHADRPAGLLLCG